MPDAPVLGVQVPLPLWRRPCSSSTRRTILAAQASAVLISYEALPEARFIVFAVASHEVRGGAFVAIVLFSFEALMDARFVVLARVRRCTRHNRP